MIHISGFRKALDDETCESRYEELLAHALDRCDLVPGATIQREVSVGDGRYRVDFLIVVGDIRVSVEVDSWEWHHETRYQVDADYRRRRYIQAQGIRPVHFSTRELAGSTQECVAELRDIVRGLVVSADVARDRWVAERESA